MKTFRTLELATKLYEEIEGLKLKGHLRDQILRSASSVALSLSEGNAKFSVDEKKRFYQIAYASLKECRTILILLKMEDSPVAKMADHLGASIYKLLNSKIISVLKSTQ